MGIFGGEEVTHDDLVLREGLYYKKSTDVPFTGKVTGQEQGSFKDGRKHGRWVSYYDNGQVWMKGTYKNGKREGTWFDYHKDGTVDEKWTGTFKNGVKVK